MIPRNSPRQDAAAGSPRRSGADSVSQRWLRNRVVTLRALLPTTLKWLTSSRVKLLSRTAAQVRRPRTGASAVVVRWRAWQVPSSSRCRQAAGALQQQQQAAAAVPCGRQAGQQ